MLALYACHQHTVAQEHRHLVCAYREHWNARDKPFHMLHCFGHRQHAYNTNVTLVMYAFTAAHVIREWTVFSENGFGLLSLTRWIF